MVRVRGWRPTQPCPLMAVTAGVPPEQNNRTIFSVRTVRDNCLDVTGHNANKKRILPAQRTRTITFLSRLGAIQFVTGEKPPALGGSCLKASINHLTPIGETAGWRRLEQQQALSKQRGWETQRYSLSKTQTRDRHPNRSHFSRTSYPMTVTRFAFSGL